MKRRQLLTWTTVNALGLGAAFLAVLQVTMLIEFGLDFDRHWQFIPPDADLWTYLARLGGALAGGLVFGLAQVVVLRPRGVDAARWIFATTAGFVLLLLIVEWPLMAMGAWGRIPGPVEPIVLAVGSCSLAGLLQHRMLRQRGSASWGWLALWIGGLVAGLLPAALLFMALASLEIALNWPMEAFISGLMPAGVAAWISGGKLSRAFAPKPRDLPAQHAM